jgi:hypothetical protein
MNLRPKIASGTDPDGVLRWSTVIEDAGTPIPLCHIISALSEHEAESNAQHVFRLLARVQNLTIDIKTWPHHLR